MLEKISAHFRQEKHDDGEEKRENDHPDNILDRVVRMKSDTVFGDTPLVLDFLDLDPVRVVGTHFVQGQDVGRHQADQHQRQGDDVKSEEPVKGHVRDHVVTPNPLGQVLTDDGNGAEQRDDDLSAPIGHLPPGKQITHKRLGHECQVDQHAEYPE